MFYVEVLLHVVYNLQTFTFKLLQKIMVMMMMTMLSYPMRKQQMEMLMKQNKDKDGNRYPMIEYLHTYILYWLVPKGLFRVKFTLRN